MARPKGHSTTKSKARSRQQRQRARAAVGSTSAAGNSVATLSAALREADPSTLRELAIERGLLRNSVRVRAWPVLLGLRQSDLLEPSQIRVEHKDANQVARDVERSRWRHDACHHGYQPEELEQHRAHLSLLVNGVLARYNDLNYFQGYHDIASIVLLITDDVRLSYGILERLSLNHFRECMRPGLEEVMGLLGLLVPLITSQDQTLGRFISDAGVPPYFALSWVLTWFSHDIADIDMIARLFDVLMVSHPMLSLYMSAALVLSARETILANPPDFPTIHTLLLKLPKQLAPEDSERMVQQALELFERVGPSELQRRANHYLPSKSLFLQYPYPFQRPWRCFQTSVLARSWNAFKFLSTNILFPRSWKRVVGNATIMALASGLAYLAYRWYSPQ